MSKIINNINLIKLSKALNKRCIDLINEEKERAMGIEQGLQAGISNKADQSYVDKKLETVDAITLNGYSIWVGTKEELDGITERDPNTLYLEIDDGTGEDVVQVDVVKGVLQLTTDKYQKNEYD